MHVKRTDRSTTRVTLTIEAGEAILAPIKDQILSKFARELKLPGFRKGKAPISLVEKNVDQSQLQTEFLDEAMTQLYAKATMQENVRPVTRPEVAIKKFVPFTELVFDVTTQVVGPISLPDYKKLRVTKEKVSVVAKDIDEVIDSLKARMAEKTDVTRGAKLSDEVEIDFRGIDATGQSVNGAEGQGYPLILGSNTFIPGFEDNIVGLKKGAEKTFTLTFPKDYGVAALAGKKVTFTVTVNAVRERKEPSVDDAFAAKVGPFKTLDELKADINKQLTAEREREAAQKQQEAVLAAITDKMKVELPEALIEQQIIYNLDELRRNLSYRGQTMQEYLESIGMDEDTYKSQEVQPQAIRQLKTSLALSEIAEKEGLSVSAPELDQRITALKQQYTDAAMQGELDKPENRQDIANRMLSEKVLILLTQE